MKQILEYVQSFTVIGLVLAGIGGVMYNMFKENGWLGMILGKVWSAQMEHPAVAIPVTIGIVFIGKMWYDHNRAKGHTSKFPDVMIYIIMAAGVYFLWKFFSQGSL